METDISRPDPITCVSTPRDHRKRKINLFPFLFNIFSDIILVLMTVQLNLKSISFFLLLPIALSPLLISTSESGSDVINQNEIILATSTSVYNSGILSFFIPLFEKGMPYRIKVIPTTNDGAVETGKNGRADLLFMNAQDLETEFIAGGFGINRREVMHNFNLILGPKNDPARIKGKDPIGALRKVAKGGFPFISSKDSPDIWLIENRLWNEIGKKPEGSWYLEGGIDMESLIETANLRSAYVLSDRGAYLARREKIKLVPLVDRHPLLYNKYSIIEVNPSRFPWINNDGARDFSDFITSNEGEDIIRRFGVERYGEELFYPR